MSNTSGSPRYTNCAFIGNYAAYVGGGIDNFFGSPIFTNCTITGNNTPNDGGRDLQCLDNGCDLYQLHHLRQSTGGEVVDDSVRSPTIITYSDVQGGYPGVGNIDADPLFVDTASGDARLQAGSPCIDAGNNAALPAGITTDLDGNPRISRARVDIGAYEYQNHAPTATAQSVSLNQGGSLPLTLTGSDPENDTLTFAVSTGPAHGTLSGTAPHLTYMPTSSYSGADSFTFKVTDAYGAVSSSATVSITVTPLPTPVEVTAGVSISAGGFTAAGGTNYTQTLTITNTGSKAITGPIYLLLDNLGGTGVQLTNLSGTTVHLTPAGRPYISLTNGIAAQSSLKILLKFSNPNRVSITDTPRLFAGPGSP